MSGGCFLIGFQDKICSGKISKIKFLLKKDIDINKEIKSSCPGEMEIMKLKADISFLGISLDKLMLLPDSREIAVHIAGYTTKTYLIILNLGGFTIPSPNLVNYKFDAFSCIFL